MHHQLDDQATIGSQQITNQLKEQFHREKLIYESQIGELQHKLTTLDNETQKYRKMYMDIVNEKNNLHDTLKQQYDEEYQQKLANKLEITIADKLDEQRASLNEKFAQERMALITEYRKQIEQNMNDLKSTREQLLKAEKQYDQIRIDKASLELKTNRTESELKEKIVSLERNSKEKEDILKLELESTKSKLELMEKEKINLEETIERLRKEKDELIKKQSDLTEKLTNEVQKSLDSDKKLAELSASLKKKTWNLRNKKSSNKIRIIN